MGQWHEAYLDLRTDFDDLETQYDLALSVIKRMERMIDENQSPDKLKSEIRGFKLGLQDLHKYLTMIA